MSRKGGCLARAFSALGGDCEIYAIDAPQGRVDLAVGWIRKEERRLTRFDSRSELSRFNAAAGRWTDVSADLEALLRACLEAHESSGGLVHAGILPALLAAGYAGTFPSGITPAGPPPLPPAPLPALLEVRRGSARLRAGAAIDLGGIAKGWLADRCCARLGTSALVNLGGDLYARGAGTTGAGWPVGFGGRTLLLEDAGAATSGTGRRRWGDGLHHLIDPRTGRPAMSELREVSVVARSGWAAEVLAKTALLLGPAGAARHLPGRALAWSLA